MRVLLKNGVIYDGLGGVEYAADILIADDRIEAVAPELKAEDAEIIDLAGLAVAPGFIDTHSHSDLLAMTEPDIPAKILQGVTSEIVGQDGVGPAPLPPAYIDVWRKNIAAFDGDSDKLDWPAFGTLDGYLSQVEKAGPGVNIAALAPHGNIRLEAMGLENRPPTAREMEQMREIT
ncbi:amidohydrolase family protein, partial [Deltaproteobacteria bacterium OttesenSCG-928-K17]|nr:amidohydrolase family protein [Deltaproteobacteria bacterium OttesenSCG-928-K17]